MSDSVRTFDSGATRTADTGKPDYEGYLSPLVIKAFGQYMTKHRVLPDGSLRASDNWQKGIPRDAYVKSLFRHFHDLWTIHRGYVATDHTGKVVTIEDTLAALLFNVQGYFHEYLKAQQVTKMPEVDLDACGTTDGVTPIPVNNSFEIQREGGNLQGPSVVYRWRYEDGRRWRLVGDTVQYHAGDTYLWRDTPHSHETFQQWIRNESLVPEEGGQG